MSVIRNIDFTDKKIRSLLAQQEAQEIKSADEFRFQLLDRIKDGRDNTGIRLPWSNVEDRLVLRPAEVSVWAGISGHFKSTLVGQVGLYASQHHKVGVMSFEMPVVDTLERMAMQASGSGKPDMRYANDFMTWAKDRVWIYDHQNTCEPARALACIEHMASLGCELVILDCLIMVRGVTRDAEKENAFISTLTQVAKALKIHIALVHHIRKPERGGDEYIPTRFDLRGASDIGDMASTVVIVWSDKKRAGLERQERHRSLKPDEKEYMKRPAQRLIVAKQRNGAFEGTIGLSLKQDAMQFYNRRPMFLDIPRLAA